MRKYFIMITVIAVCSMLCGCSDNEAGTTSDMYSFYQENDAVGESMDILNSNETNEYNNEELSYDSSVVEYSGEAFTKSVFAVGGNVIYICGLHDDGNYFLAMMNKEDEELTYIPYEFPDSMRLLRMSVDLNDNCHMLWMSTEKAVVGGNTFDSLSFDDCMVISIDKDGKILNSTDISAVFEEEQFNPFCFVADGRGYYYIENKNEIFKINIDGSYKKYCCGGAVEGIGISYSERGYVTYSTEGETKLAYLYDDKINECNISLPKSETLYSCLSPAYDTDIILYSKADGVYAYDKDEDILTQRISSETVPVNAESIAGYGIMSDERLCLLEQSDNITRFYYIPCAE